MEAIIPITAGLLLDICGGFLIIQHLLYDVNTGTRAYHTAIENFDRFNSLVSEMARNSESGWDPNVKEELIVQYGVMHVTSRTIQWGFVFLSFGFFLVLIGNWM